jgi:quercetin dioxygenase-like cupin family protein
MRKVSVKDTPPDAKTHPDLSGVRVLSLITSATVGSQRGMLSIAEFAPGGAHKLHRHPNCEQATFLLTGKGEHLTQQGSVRQETGDAIYIAKGEWHGFRNTGIDVATLVTLHSVGALPEAGYESFRLRQGYVGQVSGVIESEGEARAKVVRLRDLQGDASLDRDSGFIGLGVFWLITRETVGANSILLGASTFEPGGVHEHHRHPNGDEFLFIVEGGGKHLTPNEAVSLSTGEIAYIPANEYHGFDNPPGVLTKTLFGYFGPASLAEAGYEVRK